MEDEAGQRRTRPALLWQLSLLGRKPHHDSGAAEDSLLFPDAAPPPATLETIAPEPFPLTDYTPEQRLRYEQELLEVCASGHPLDLAPRNGEAWSSELGRYRGRRVTLLGWLITFRHVGTKDYRNMMFATCEDQRGIYEAVLFPEAYERYGGLVFETRTMRVTGRVEQEGQINCEKLEPVRP